MRQAWTALLAAALLGPDAVGPAEAGSTETDVQQWTTASATHHFTHDWSAGLFVQGRFRDDNSEEDQLLVSPTIRYGFAEGWTAGLGYRAWIKKDASDENDILQEIGYGASYGKLGVGHRARLEERFIHNVDGVLFRTRYRLRLAHPIGGSRWYGAAWNEVFFNLNNLNEGPPRGFEQNRLFGGVGAHLGEHFRLEGGYMWRFKESRSGRDESQHVLMLSLFAKTRPKPSKGSRSGPGDRPLEGR